MLETVSNFFYDPVIFWGAPLILAALMELAGRLRRSRTRSRR